MSSLIRKLLAGLSSAPDGPTIALLSDFGERDTYVGTMRAVIASISPQARVIDITHQVRPQSTQEGAYALWSAYRYFPRATIFAAVVDPGVGTDRDILILESDDFMFVAPDNGILDLVATEITQRSVHALRVGEPGGKWRRYARPELSRTFHGRDIFAPVAAHLSLGVTPGQIGDARRPVAPSTGFCDVTKGTDPPRILHIDRFGNVITNVRVPNETALILGLKVGRHRVTGWIQAYQDGPLRKPRLIAGSSGLVEIVVRNGNAATLLGTDITTSISLLAR